MTFYLGIHHAHWLERLPVPMFCSRRTLAARKKLPRALSDWCLDSGGFTELSRTGRWLTSAREYAVEVRRYRDEIGRLQWAAPQDWMCEPEIIERTGLSVVEHQNRTLANYLDLQNLAADLPWIPVLQGWLIGDYERHRIAYERAGVCLERMPVVGVGTVCRRQHLREAEAVLRSLSPLPLHAFGFKTTGLLRAGDGLASADSMAWSYGARRRGALAGCSHRNCANCPRWALLWRQRLIERLSRAEKTRQLVLPF